MQIRYQIVQLLLRQGRSRHHIASPDNGLLHEIVVGNQTAGKVLSAKQPFQSGALQALGRIGAVADAAMSLEDMATMYLLRIQPQLRIGLEIGVLAAGGRYHRQ